MSSDGNAAQEEEAEAYDWDGAVRPSIHLRLIRHAESVNNEIYRDARKIYGGGTDSFDLEGWTTYVDSRRDADPGLSAVGIAQAERLAEQLVEELGGSASSPLRIIVSPMRRALATLLPTLRRLRGGTGGRGEGEEGLPASVLVHASYFESEGCHLKDVPQPGMSPEQIGRLLAPALADERPAGADAPDPPVGASFEGFGGSAVGWYAGGTGPETRAESEQRASRFYIWLTEHLDAMLAEPSAPDVFDAGVASKGEGASPRRRTVVLVGHGDFMALLLRRIVAGYGHSVEAAGLTHRTAFVHHNTGQTDLEYFGRGRFLLMATNRVPHLPLHLRTGGTLTDGWAYLMPPDRFLLDAEVSVTAVFEDEVQGHVKEQADAMRRLYLPQAGQAQEGGTGSEKFWVGTGTGTGTGEKQQEQDGQGDVTQLSVLRGHQVVGCASFRCATGALSDVVVRPSARRSQVGRALVESAREKAREAGTKLLAVWPSTEEGRTFFIRLGFKRDGDGGDNGKGTTPSRMILTP